MFERLRGGEIKDNLRECRTIYQMYSLVRLVVPNTEELISQPFRGSIKDPIAVPGRHEVTGV